MKFKSEKLHRKTCFSFWHKKIKKLKLLQNFLPLDHITVVCLVAWPLNENEAGVDIDLVETSLLFLC